MWERGNQTTTRWQWAAMTWRSWRGMTTPLVPGLVLSRFRRAPENPDDAAPSSRVSGDSARVMMKIIRT